MGTDIYPILTVRQLDAQATPRDLAVIVEELNEQFDKDFEYQGGDDPQNPEGPYGIDQGTRWSSMVEDMTEFSKKHPGVLFGIQYEWPEDGSEYMEWFENGRYYFDARPDWIPIFQEAKFLKDTNAQVEPVTAEPTTGDPYTVVVEYETLNSSDSATFLAPAFGKTPDEAAQQAIDGLIDDEWAEGFDEGDTVAAMTDEQRDQHRADYKCIAIYAGHHTNLVQ